MAHLLSQVLAIWGYKNRPAWAGAHGRCSMYCSCLPHASHPSQLEPQQETGGGQACWGAYQSHGCGGGAGGKAPAAQQSSMQMASACGVHLMTSLIFVGKQGRPRDTQQRGRAWRWRDPGLDGHLRNTGARCGGAQSHRKGKQQYLNSALQSPLLPRSRQPALRGAQGEHGATHMESTQHCPGPQPALVPASPRLAPSGS